MKWTIKEMDVVLKEFAAYFRKSVLPGKKEITAVLSNPATAEVLKHRTWQNVKDFIRNNSSIRNNSRKTATFA